MAPPAQKELLRQVQVRLLEAFPKAVLTGAVTRKQIMNSRLMEQAVVVTVTLFTRSEVEGEVCAETQFTEHTYCESGVPLVLVGGDYLLHRAVVCRYRLRSHAHELQILQVCSHHHTEVERSQIGIRSILHLCVLRFHSRAAHQQGEQNQYMSCNCLHRLSFLFTDNVEFGVLLHFGRHQCLVMA